jgi:hypothetical protein
VAGPFDDLVPVPPPREREERRPGAFDDLVPSAPSRPPPPGWGEWLRDAFTGERRTEFPDLEEFSTAYARRGGMRDLERLPRGRNPRTFWEHVRRGLGSTEFDAPPPTADERPVGGITGIMQSSITPDPRAQLDILRRHFGDLEHRTDRFGNIMVRAPSSGVSEWTYLNRPGMSSRDWEEFGTQFLATLPFGAAVGLGRNVASRALIGGGALGGASIAQDIAAGAMGSEQGIDPTRAGVSAGIGALAGPLAGWLANRAVRTPTPLAVGRADDAIEDAAAHARLDVRPFGPGFGSGPVAGMAKQLTEMPYIGGPVRKALEESISDTAGAARNIASRYGAAETADEAGLVAREALERFRNSNADVAGSAGRIATERGLVAPADEAGQRALVISAPVRESSLKTKQNALYERAWSLIPEEMRHGRAVQDLPRVMGSMAETRNVLDNIAARNTRMTNAQSGTVEAGTGRTLPGGFLGQVIEAMRNPRWSAALQTMRDIRSDFRRLQSGIAQTEGAVLRHSDIDRIESAITRDMIALLERNVNRYAGLGQPQVANNIRHSIAEFRRADRFTRGAMQRMEAIERLFNADNPTALYRAIAQAAMGGSRGDVAKLRVLARTLRRDEMDEIAAYTLRAMGEPAGSARGVVQQVHFSPSSFMTRLNNMQAEAREIIFGRAHVQALNDLGRVVNRLANVEALANTSRSATNALQVGSLLGAGGAIAAGMDAFMTALGTVGAGFAASVIFSRPAYVRWAIGYAQLRAAVAQSRSRMLPAMAAHIARLEALSMSDPTLLPIVRGIRADEGINDEPERDPRPRGQRTRQPGQEGRNANLDAAHRELTLTAQERALYERHLDNLYGPGGIDHPSGDRYTVLPVSIEGPDGRTYLVPTVFNGRSLEPDTPEHRRAIDDAGGLSAFPSYATREEADARYNAIYEHMGRDAQAYRRGRRQQPKGPR